MANYACDVEEEAVWDQHGGDRLALERRVAEPRERKCESMLSVRYGRDGRGACMRPQLSVGEREDSI
eukprot:754408-Hanusia_phi.AAC.1